MYVCVCVFVCMCVCVCVCVCAYVYESMGEYTLYMCVEYVHMYAHNVHAY